MTRGVGVLLLSILFVAASSAGTASAQAGDGEEGVASEDEAALEGRDDETSRIHFEAGRAHFDAGRYEDALEEFMRAYEVSERPELLYNVGLAHERLGNYAEAADALERFNLSRDEPDNTLAERIENLRRRAEERARAEQTPTR